jgi:hypothetical protein
MTRTTWVMLGLAVASVGGAVLVVVAAVLTLRTATGVVLGVAASTFVVPERVDEFVVETLPGFEVPEGFAPRFAWRFGPYRVAWFSGEGTGWAIPDPSLGPCFAVIVAERQDEAAETPKAASLASLLFPAIESEALRVTTQFVSGRSIEIAEELVQHNGRHGMVRSTSVPYGDGNVVLVFGAPETFAEADAVFEDLLGRLLE